MERIIHCVFTQSFITRCSAGQFKTYSMPWNRIPALIHYLISLVCLCYQYVAQHVLITVPFGFILVISTYHYIWLRHNCRHVEKVVHQIQVVIGYNGIVIVLLWLSSCSLLLLCLIVILLANRIFGLLGFLDIIGWQKHWAWCQHNWQNLYKMHTLHRVVIFGWICGNDFQISTNKCSKKEFEVLTYVCR